MSSGADGRSAVPGGRSEGSAAAPGDLDMTETDHATGRTEWGGRVGVGNCRHCCHLGGSA